MRKVITVDGQAGSGKSTLAKLLAQRLGFAHFNSGLLYRAIAFLASGQKVPLDNGPLLAALLDQHAVELRLDPARGSQLYIDGSNVTAEVSTSEISRITPLVAELREVRQRLIKTQREIFPGMSLVAEGRDMGTVIFPESPLKFFVHADIDVRVARRVQMLFGTSPESERNLLIQRAKKELQERDLRDTERLEAPLRQAPDALNVDNSERALTDVVQSMYDVALRRGLS